MRADRTPSFLILLVVAGLAGRAVCGDEVRLGPEGEHLRPVRYAAMEISGRVPERLPEIYTLRPDVHTLEDLLRRLNAAAEDRDVEGLVVRLGRFGGGWAKAHEIRSAFRRVSGKGKEVVVYLEEGGNLPYYIATAADRLIMPPTGSFMFLGLRGEVIFLRGLFDKVGITPDFLQVGAYKGASDPFTDEAASDEFAEAINDLFDSLFATFVRDIADARGLEAAAVVELIDAGPSTPAEAAEAGLIDGVKFYDELLEDLRRSEEAPFELVRDYGKEEVTALPLGEGTQRLLKRLLGMRVDLPEAPDPEGNVIAVLYAVGPVVMERPETAMLEDSVIDARLMVEILGELRDNPNVRAVVMRVESPGGDAQASDMVWRAMRRTDRVKPVITSISDVAGSGGYYVACGGRYIFASEGSLTGSIGVMGGKFVVKDLFEKLGLHVEVYQRGRHAGLFSPVETFSEDQKRRFRRLLDATYETFLGRVQDSRGMTGEELEGAAEGRPLTGARALELNLIDEIGGLQDAIGHARKAAGIDPQDEVELLLLPKSQSLLDAIFLGRDIGVDYPPGLLRAQVERLLPDPAAEGLQYLNAVANLRDYRPAALMPALIRVR